MPTLGEREERRSRGVVLLLAAGVCSCAHLPARESFEPARRLIQEGVEGSAATSVAVAVARGDRVLWEEGFGWADREKGIPAGPHTLYSVASVSKPFTATGLMVLVERGLLELDRPANDYLGEVRLHVRVGRARDVTLRRLADHTSGLPLHHHFFPSDEPFLRPPMETTIRRYGNIVAPAGEGFQYSNLGYGVLEHVIERVSGLGFPEFMEREVFAPLGLEHTAVVLDPSRHTGLAARYRPDGTRLPFYDFDHRGASALYACAHDLVRFGMFHLEADLEDQVPVLSGRARHLMRRPTSYRDGGGYGVGWSVSEHSSGLPLVEHGGDMPGVSAVLTLVPAARLAVAVVASAPHGVARRARDAILGALLPAKRLDKGGARVTRLQDAPRGGEQRRPPRWARGRWSGSVDTESGAVAFRLTVEKDGVRARMGTHPETAVRGARFRGRWIEGSLAERIDTPDTRERAHRLHLSVRRRGDRLQGAITAVSFPGAGLPLALSFWMDLQKERTPR